MRLCICFLTMMAALAAAEKPRDTKPRPAKKAAGSGQAKTAAPAVTIPAGAVEVEPGTFRYTDAQGKKWLYRRTPFGVARLEDKPAVAGDAANAQRDREIEEVTAVEDGDSIRFERSGPFGRYKWQRKKTELDEKEKAGWDRARRKTAGHEEAKPE